MLVRITSRFTVFPEESIVLGVGNNIYSQATVKFKPLRPFSPVAERDIRKHIAAVTAATITSRLIIGLHKAVAGANEVLIDSEEVIDWNAAL